MKVRAQQFSCIVPFIYHNLWRRVKCQWILKRQLKKNFNIFLTFHNKLLHAFFVNTATYFSHNSIKITNLTAGNCESAIIFELLMFSRALSSSSIINSLLSVADFTPLESKAQCFVHVKVTKSGRNLPSVVRRARPREFHACNNKDNFMRDSSVAFGYESCIITAGCFLK